MNKAVRQYIGKRLYAYVYILHKLFDGDTKEFCRAMRIPDVYPVDVQKWDAEYGEMVDKDIDADARLICQMRDGDGDIPTVASLKDSILLRVQQLITKANDPSKLATCYRVLAEFGKDSKKSRGGVGAAQAIMERMQPKDSRKRLMRNEVEREHARLHPEDDEQGI